MKENDIMKLITQDFSWEQVLYKIIAWEGLDPWDLDVGMLSSAFVEYINKMEMLDFRVPAKYVIISAVLLRMKSEHLHFIDWLTNPEEPGVEDVGGEVDQGEAQKMPQDIDVNPITVPPVRFTKRKIMANELVLALRKVLNAQDRRIEKRSRARKQIKVSEDNITLKITELYDRINRLLTKIEENELKFSKVVKKWGRKEIVETFIPLIYLHSERKLECRQEELFSEIFISRPSEKAKTAEEVKALPAGKRIRRLIPAV